MAKKLWDKGLPIDQKIESFTIGKDKDWDLRLARYDVEGSIAHVSMLEKVGLLTTDEKEALVAELNTILSDIILPGNFVIEEGVEDVHSQIEWMLTRSLGDLGKKIHSGRSRNDQVLLDLKLYFRAEVLEMVSQINDLFTALLDQSERHKEVLLPGYTHTQAAMPSSFGLWFAAYAESLKDDVQLLHAAYKIINLNPLGSAAGYGSSFPLDRWHTTELLAFDGLNTNVVYAQMGRGKVEQTLSYALAGVAQTLNKFASDVCLYNSGNFGFLRLPDELTTGSSIMPHKKNPDVFELIRAKTNVITTVPMTVSRMIGNLSSGYHRDFQLLKDAIFPAIDDLKEILDMMSYAVPKIKPNEKILDDPKYNVLYSVERVNELVVKGMPFRDAYIQVGKELSEGEYEPPKELHHTLLGSLGNLGNEHIKTAMQELMDLF